MIVQDKLLIVTTIILMGCSYQDFKYRGISVWLLAIGNIWGLGIAIYRCIYGYTNIGMLIISIMPGLLLIVVALLTTHIGIADGIILVMLGMVLSPLSIYLLLLFASMLALIFSSVLIIMGRKNNRFPFVPFVLLSYIGMFMVIL